MDYGLPKSVEVDGNIFEIRYDFRVILDIFEVMNDPELDDQDKGLAVLQIFYVDLEGMTDYNAALVECFKFINGGTLEDQNQKKKQPKLVDWAQDFPHIVAPVNRILGQEIRAVPYDIETNTGGVHWWTFLAGYEQIGNCLFAQIVSIRDKKARGKKLDKEEREFYRRNRELIDIKTHYTDAENAVINAWLGK